MRVRGAGGGRLAVALLLSLSLHLLALSLLPTSGSPVRGGGASGAPSPRLVVHFLDETAGFDEIARSASGEQFDLLEEKGGALVAESLLAATGLPIAKEEYGPPFPLPSPIYFFPSDLEQPPRALTALPEEFPELAGKTAAGRLVFSVLIDENGKVDEAINEMNTLSPEFVAPVQRAIEQMRFEPGIKGGKAVKSRTRIEVNFTYSVLE